MRIKLLGREVLINKAATSVPVSDVPYSYFSSFGGNANYVFGENHKWVEDYKQCPPLKSIIDKINTAFTNGNTVILDKTTKKPVENLKSIESILSNPNALQTQTQFEAQRNTYLALYGWSIVLKFKPVGYEKDPLAVASRWVLPNEELIIKWNENPIYTNNRASIIKSIHYRFNGRNYPLDVDSCFVYTHLGAPYLGGNVVPSSPLLGLEYPIGNIIRAYKATGNLLENNGAMGILSNDAVDKTVGSIPMIDNEAKEQLQEDFRGYGHQNGQNPMIITSLPLKWQAMSLPIRDLMLSEIKEEDTLAIAERLGFPKDLLNASANSTYENAKQAAIDLYQNTIIPMADHIYEQETADLLNGTNYEIVGNYEHVAALQEDEGRKAKAEKDWASSYKVYWESDLMTKNQILELRGIEKVVGGDVYYSQWLKQNETNETSGA
jgi:hypothetical protein